MRKKLKRCPTGFTLPELILVILLVGIIIFITIPKFLALTQDAKETATRSGLGTIRSVVAILYAKNLANNIRQYPPSLSPSDFAESRTPVNRLNEKSEVKYVTQDVKENCPTSPEYGWWYNVKDGRVGAFSDGKTDTSKW